MNERKGQGQDNIFFQEAFSRNIGLLTQDEQHRLREAKVAIAGAGGVGGFHLMTLVRLGVGKFHIADMDVYETANLQRQCGATMQTLGKNKAEAMREKVLAVNPYLDIQTWPEGVTEENIDSFLEGADVFIDGIDFFSFDIRRLLFQKAREKGLYAITAGPLGFGSGLLVFSPQGMSFDEYFDIREDMTYREKIIAFAVGLAPAGIHLRYLRLKNVSLDAKSGPSLVSACHLCSALAATEALKILLQRKNIRPAPYYFQFDPYEQIYKKGCLWGANKNPVQQLKRWYLGRKFSAKKKSIEDNKG